MSRLISLVCLIITFPIAGKANDYQGSVGKMRAVFSLEWKADRVVTGSYRYPDRPGITYSLLGNNDRDGELYLEEYTGGQLTAECYLQKRLTADLIIWHGEMRNTDGRKFPMHFARPREGKSPVPVSPITTSYESDGAKTYNGRVGKLAAVFQIRWLEGRRVSGTYHYPLRSGVTYQLNGSNPREGELLLDEYTNGALTARCSLRKRLTKSQIIWEGVMRNTDGRELAMSFSRARAASAPMETTGAFQPASRDAELLGKISTDIEWSDFPLADEVIEMVPIYEEGTVGMTGRVESFVSTPEGLTMTFRLGLNNELDWDDIRFTGPVVTFKAARHLPLPPEEILNREVYLQYRSSGELYAVGVHAIAMTHIRKAPDGEKMEVRGLLYSDALGYFEQTPLARRESLINQSDSITLKPDKLAMLDFGETEFFFRGLRLVKDYGISIQADAAGPGMLELEGMSLEETTPENPWIFLGGESKWELIPPTQRTGEAG